MAIVHGLTNAAKLALLNGEIDFSSDTARSYKVALYTAAATLNASTASYTTANEVNGTGYTAGGLSLSIAQNPQIVGNVAIMTFGNALWSNSTISARGALIYDAASLLAVAVLDFGEVVQTTNGNFEVQFPSFTPSDAIVRVG